MQKGRRKNGKEREEGSQKSRREGEREQVRKEGRMKEEAEKVEERMVGMEGGSSEAAGFCFEANCIICTRIIL